MKKVFAIFCFSVLAMTPAQLVLAVSPPTSSATAVTAPSATAPSAVSAPTAPSTSVVSPKAIVSSPVASHTVAPVVTAPASTAPQTAAPSAIASSVSSLSAVNEKAAALLARLSANIAALGNYRVGFSVDAEGSQAQGSYIVSGNRFKITTPEFEVISNGVSRHEINHELREVIVDVMDTTDVNILVNPIKAFEFVQNGFIPSYGGAIEVGGVICDLVEMKPTIEGFAISGVKLYVGRGSGLPVRLEYGLEGFDEKIAVAVSAFRADPDIKPSDFLFDKSKYKGYEVVDFR